MGPLHGYIELKTNGISHHTAWFRSTN